jgi:hypothetical protein
MDLFLRGSYYTQSVCNMGVIPQMYNRPLGPGGGDWWPEIISLGLLVAILIILCLVFR